jgi:hypothetical protein
LDFICGGEGGIRTGGAAKKLLLQTKPRISELFGATVLSAFNRENVRLQFGICANESLSLKAHRLDTTKYAACWAVNEVSNSPKDNANH